MEGVRWREFSFAEILWLAHTRTMDRLQEHSPQRVRLYLNQVKDYTALRAWDNSQIRDSRDK